MKRLIVSLIFAVIATTIGAGWIINQFHSTVYQNTSEIDSSLSAYKQLGKALGLTLDDLSQRDEFIRSWEARSQVVISIQDLRDFPVPDDLNQNFVNGTPLILESDGELSLHVYMKNSEQVMTMLLPVRSSNKQRTLLNLLLTLFFYFVVIVVLLAWLYPLIKRLVVLQKAAEQFGRGDLSSRISSDKMSYIFDIEKAFNRMASQIQKLIDDNKLLSRAVSHNLKTPITRLRMGIDVLEETTDPSAINEYIERINRDLDEMQSLVETLLQYSSLDEFNLELKLERIDLRRYIPELIENMTAQNIAVSVHFTDDNLVVSADPRYLAMQLSNIMSNALQYAKSAVEVRVQPCGNDQHSGVSITIEDDGNGILEANWGQVVQPFWRANDDPSIKGHGMGLAIVARIADWHKARLVIRDSVSLGGACIQLVFKSNQEPLLQKRLT